MKLSLVKYKQVYSYADLRDDHTVDEMLDIYFGILKSCGYNFKETDHLCIVNEEEYDGT